MFIDFVEYLTTQNLRFSNYFSFQILLKSRVLDAIQHLIKILNSRFIDHIVTKDQILFMILKGRLLTSMKQPVSMYNMIFFLQFGNVLKLQFITYSMASKSDQTIGCKRQPIRGSVLWNLRNSQTQQGRYDSLH